MTTTALLLVLVSVLGIAAWRYRHSNTHAWRAHRRALRQAVPNKCEWGD